MDFQLSFSLGLATELWGSYTDWGVKEIVHPKIKYCPCLLILMWFQMLFCGLCYFAIVFYTILFNAIKIAFAAGMA